MCPTNHTGRIALTGMAVLAIFLAATRGLADETSSTTSALPGKMSVAVSARVLKPAGRSHWELYLYRGNGTLVRQLTSENGSDKIRPVFSPDGQFIAYTSIPAKGVASSSGQKGEIRIVGLDGQSPHRWEGKTTAPAWYTSAAPATPIPIFPSTENASPDILGTSDTVHPGASAYRDPTKRFEFVMTTGSIGSDRDSWLRNLETHKEEKLTSITGYGSSLASNGEFGFQNIVPVNGGGPWYYEPPMLAALFFSHLDSTDGTSFFLLDPFQPEIHELSPNSAQLFHCGNLPFLLVLNQVRYQQYGEGSKTANFLFLDLWSSDFHRYRYSPEKAISGGASFFIPAEGKGENGVYTIDPEEMSTGY